MRWTLVLVSLLLSFQTIASQLVVRVGEDQVVHLSHTDVTTKLSASSFTTKLPWYANTNKYTGFKVSELLQYLSIDDAFSVSFIALNDYAASSQIEDILKYEPIVAYKMNDKNMKVRNKGPYWLVFNLDENPEIDNAVFHSQMVWQIDEIMVHRKQDVENK
ncbi:molybdopterin-dependent oxidoreductase [Vibrio tubiashii]|uniref:molybdopterin-dependent oxidoreductase n=1 Tax=Vibrio tubiashii TaxID=29498 RepID=UPI00349E77BA